MSSEITPDILITDLMLRVTVLENLLIKSNLVSKEDYENALQEITKLASEKVIASLKK